jgi:tetratricopeptide (TPR) repeat protein
VETAPSSITPAAEALPPAASLAATPENFGPLSNQCHKLMAAHADVTSVVTICGAMAAAADSFPPDSRFIERRAAYVFDAAALLRAWRYPEAEAMAERAVALVEEGHDDFTGASAAYAVLGNAQALNGKLAQADKNLETAETLERKALEAANAQQQQVYSTTLRTILLFHADTLDRMGNKPAGDAKRAEAARLLPVAG